MKVLLFIGLLLWESMVSAQDRSVRFENITFQEALVKAKESHKLLFIDCYTPWCGPCKMLAKEVFTVNEVADFFNARFISLKLDCTESEGIKFQERFGVTSYPTLFFLDGDGKVVHKILGACRQPVFLEEIKKGLDPEQSLQNKIQRYEAGERDRNFLLDLIFSYKKVEDSKHATEVSLELLHSSDEKELISKTMWEVVRYYYVSEYGSEWWKFIIEHSDEYDALLGKGTVAAKIGETLHPCIFRYICIPNKTVDKQLFEDWKALVDKYQPTQKEALYAFIKLAESACRDHFNGYFKTMMKVVPDMPVAEHYRFFANTFNYLSAKANVSQKKQLLALLKDSQTKSTDHFKPLFQRFIDKINV